MRKPCDGCCRSSTSTMRAFRSGADCCSGAAAPPVTTRSSRGYARGASDCGVDIIQNCEVTGFLRDGNRVVGVNTSRGAIRCGKIELAVAGSGSRVAGLLGLRLPIESHLIQAFVSEAIKPSIPGVVTFGAGHFYISQSDKGGLVFGGDIDGYNSYAQRGNLPVVEDVCEGGVALMPAIGRLRILRSWAGLLDMSMDGSPIIDRTPEPVT
jgi:methylglutamate dehydrogenase subunit A